MSAVQMEPLADLPWVLAGPHPSGAVPYGAPMCVAQCQVCAATYEGYCEQLGDFADAHAAHQSASPTHQGAGDLVAQLAKSLGFQKPCTPCEQRRQALNAALPHVPFFRR